MSHDVTMHKFLNIYSKKEMQQEENVTIGKMTGKWTFDIVLLAFHSVKDIKVYDRALTGN